MTYFTPKWHLTGKKTGRKYNSQRLITRVMLYKTSEFWIVKMVGTS